MNLRILISFFILIGFNYAEHSWIISNLKASKAATKNDITEARKQYEKSQKSLKKESNYEHIELLLTELKMMRLDCLSGKEISVEKLSKFTLRLGEFYHPTQIKLFNDIYQLCFHLYNSKQYKACWWLLRRVQKIFLNKHEVQQLKSLNIMRLGLQDLTMLALRLLESNVWVQFHQDPQRRTRLLNETLLDADMLGCGLASLRLASAAFKSGQFSLAVRQTRTALMRLQGDINYLLEYVDKNQNRIGRSHSILIYLKAMIYGIQEVRDLLELARDKVSLNKYFSVISDVRIEQFLSSLDAEYSQKIIQLKKFVSDQLLQDDNTPDAESIKFCNESMQKILRGLRLHNIASGIWLEFDASNNFEKAYGYLKNLASNQYIDLVPRSMMRKCFLKLKFKHPNLSTDYDNLTIEQ